MWRLLPTALLPMMAATAMGLEFDAFLEIHEKSADSALSGASQDKIYHGWTKIYGFEHGTSNPVAITSGSSGAGSGKATFLPIKIAKAVDQITPVLTRATCLGTQFDHVKLVLVARDRNRTEVWDLTLKTAAISEQTWTTSTNGTPLEGVLFTCGEMVVNFTALENPTLSSQAGWSVVENASVAEPDKQLAVDSDSDGIPDVFEKRYGLKPDFADGSADLDGDGMSNLLEYIANTDPTKPDSVLRAQLKPAPAAGMLEVSWQGTPGTTYRVEYCETLGGPYSSAGTFYSESTQEMQAFVPSGTGSSRFYRVTVVE